MNPEPRLPQIDPVTFAALSTLDMLLARAPLTRNEHAEANKSLQHLVQTIEVLQVALKQLNAAKTPAVDGPSAPSSNGHAGFSGGPRTAAEAAEEIFRNK